MMIGRITPYSGFALNNRAKTNSSAPIASNNYADSVSFRGTLPKKLVESANKVLANLTSWGLKVEVPSLKSICEAQTGSELGRDNLYLHIVNEVGDMIRYKLALDEKNKVITFIDIGVEKVLNAQALGGESIPIDEKTVNNRVQILLKALSEKIDSDAASATKAA